MRRGVLACTAIGKYRRVDPRDLDAFLNKNRLQPREDAEYSPQGCAPNARGQKQPAGARGQQRQKHSGSRRRSGGAAQPTQSVEGAAADADGG